MEWRREDGYWVSDDKRHLNIDRIHRWLSDESYWAAGRSIDVVSRSIEGSITCGCYASDGTQVGVCRWVTDSATFGWLCDVFIDTAHRGSGLGIFMVGSAMDHPAVQGLRLLALRTRDAHGLYSRFGFGPSTGNWMDLLSPGAGLHVL
jgi:GNAT superfamily N-acetyltransferase